MYEQNNQNNQVITDKPKVAEKPKNKLASQRALLAKKIAETTERLAKEEEILKEKKRAQALKDKKDLAAQVVLENVVLAEILRTAWEKGADLGSVKDEVFDILGRSPKK